MTKKKNTKIVDFEEMLLKGTKDGPFAFDVETVTEFPKSKYGYKNKIYQTFKILTTTDDNFLEEVNKIRKKWDIPAEIPDEKWKEFDNEIKQLRKLFKLPETYHGLLSLFVENKEVRENILELLIDYPPAEFVVDPKSIDEQFLYIKIYPETTLNDVKELWEHSIEHMKRKYLKCSLKKMPDRPNLDRDIKIFKLWKNGVNPQNVAKIVNELHPKTPISYLEVAKIASRLINRAPKKS